MATLLDTCFLYALKDQDDPKHEEAQEILKKLISPQYFPLVTSSAVVSETYTLMMFRSNGNISKLTILDNMFWGRERFFQIIYLDSRDFQEIATYIKKYSSPKKQLSFVDASLIYLGNKIKSTQIISFDSHFDGILTRIFL
jgi:predicted nucleic acid-binding protein